MSIYANSLTIRFTYEDSTNGYMHAQQLVPIKDIDGAISPQMLVNMIAQKLFDQISAVRERTKT